MMPFTPEWRSRFNTPIPDSLHDLEQYLVDAGLCSWRGGGWKPHPHSYVQVVAQYLKENNNA